VGQDRVGGTVTVTLTVNWHVPVFPELSVAVHVMGVMPSGNGAALALGLHEAVLTPLPSLTVRFVEYVVSDTVGTPVDGLATTFNGHVIVGGVLSILVMVKLQ